MKEFYLFSVAILAPFFLSGCHATAPPKHPKNICKIFTEYPSWFWSTKKSYHKWGVPINVQMAIIYEESHFRAHAEPPHRQLLGFIPWFRPTTATGYAQAVDETWHRYIKSQQRLSGARDDFAEACNFIGWYADFAHHQLHIARHNARALYLAYHEGIGGYRRRSYVHKKWLLHVANKVQRNATRYGVQLLRCSDRLPREPWWHKIL